MGVGAALQQIGTMYLQRNWQKQDQAKAQEQAQKQRAQDLQEWKEKQAFLARLGAPQERVRSVYDEQLRNAVAVRERWQPGDEQTPGRWIEDGRDVIPPKQSSPELKTFRQGDEEVTAVIDPMTGNVVKEVGRGSAFSPSQRRASRGGGGGTGPDGEPLAPDAAKSAGKASDWVIENGVRVNKLTGEEAPLKVTQQSLRETEEAKARGQNAQTLIEKAEAARQQLAILDRMEELQKQTRTGPLGQYTQPRWASESAQEFDAQATRLLGPTLKSMFGANPTEGERKSAAGALPSRDKDETVNQKLIQQLREQATRQIAAADSLRAGGPSGSSPAAGQQGSRDNPVPISSEAEADKLPPGTWVILNGRLGQT